MLKNVDGVSVRLWKVLGGWDLIIGGWVITDPFFRSSGCSPQQRDARSSLGLVPEPTDFT